MPNKPVMSRDEFLATLNAARKRAQTLLRVQLAFTAMCWALLIAAIAAKFLGGSSNLVMTLALLGSTCGLGSWVTGRMAKPIYDKADEIQKAIGRAISAIDEKSTDTEPPKIPLTIGFANLSGEDFSAIASQDATALSPLFARSRIVSEQQLPSAEILFVYAHLNEDGTIKGPTQSGIRQIVQLECCNSHPCLAQLG